MSNPYFIDEPAVISFSGGRTSAFMLYQILQAHGGKLPDYIRVCFANTGKEMPQTLDFVRDCGEQWGVDIVWIELCGLDRIVHKGKRNELVRRYKTVTHETASRNGEPFDILVNGLDAIPNVVARSCSPNLKARGIDWFVEENEIGEHIRAIGLRADEKRRAIKMRGKTDGNAELYMPMYEAGDDVRVVSAFWAASNFDLQLPNNNGSTDWGNCDLCFLKAKGKRLSIIRERPELADWWIDVETRKQQRFRKDEPSYAEMKIIATDQPTLFDGLNDETIPCFCGD